MLYQAVHARSKVLPINTLRSGCFHTEKGSQRAAFLLPFAPSTQAYFSLVSVPLAEIAASVSKVYTIPLSPVTTYMCVNSFIAHTYCSEAPGRALLRAAR